MDLKKTGNAGSIWIIGLSSSGKTTLARLLSKRLWENGRPNILLDGDQIRDLFEERLGYDVESRRKQTRRVERLARLISGGGVLPVVAIIHPFEDDRARCRKGLKGYFEVYLKCDLETCMARDTKNVYSPVLKGQAKNVLGLDIPYEDPKNADVVLDSGRTSPDEMLETLWRELEKRWSKTCAE
ncbi:MAG: adenylyl-sulfate kinase [Candidatus Omnitrophota bacterium]